MSLPGIHDLKHDLKHSFQRWDKSYHREDHTVFSPKVELKLKKKKCPNILNYLKKLSISHSHN